MKLLKNLSDNNVHTSPTLPYTERLVDEVPTTKPKNSKDEHHSSDLEAVEAAQVRINSEVQQRLST
jgi:hypothetical protein